MSFVRISISIIALLSLGCASGPFAGQKGVDPVYFAWAPLKPTVGQKAKGTFLATEAFGKIKIEVRVEGLAPKSRHALQIHRWGDCRQKDGSSAGPVYSPSGPVVVGEETRHIGQLGDLVANEKGVAEFRKSYADMSLSGNKNPIIGRGVILFEEAAELTDHPETRRIACGVIGAVKKK